MKELGHMTWRQTFNTEQVFESGVVLKAKATPNDFILRDTQENHRSFLNWVF